MSGVRLFLSESVQMKFRFLAAGGRNHKCLISSLMPLMIWRRPLLKFLQRDK